VDPLELFMQANKGSLFNRFHSNSNLGNCPRIYCYTRRSWRDGCILLHCHDSPNVAVTSSACERRNRNAISIHQLLSVHDALECWLRCDEWEYRIWKATNHLVDSQRCGTMLLLFLGPCWLLVGKTENVVALMIHHWDRST
jgi:hypothetical protein